MFKAGYGEKKIKELEAANAETTKSKSSNEINFLHSWPIWYISLGILLSKGSVDCKLALTSLWHEEF